MDTHRLEILDNHIFVLKNMEVMISKELENLTEERQRIAQRLGLTDNDGTDAVNDPMFSCTHRDLSSCALGDDSREKESHRSGSPASVLDNGVVDDDYVAAVNDNHAVGLQLLGTLSTPRGAQCLDEADPDMNNLSDSEEEGHGNDLIYSVAPRMLTEMAGLSQGDDDKVPRSPSSLNNAESDSDVEEEDVRKPYWISNAIYTSALVDMVHREETEESTSVTHSFQKIGRIAGSFLAKDNADTICMRSYSDWLIKKAAAANGLTNEIERMKKELKVREDMIHLHWEKHRRYKAALREEIINRQRETDMLRNQRNEASSAKFLMFCRLQEAEERVDQLEKELKSLRLNKDDTSEDEKERPTSDGMVTLTVHAQGRTLSQTPSFDFTPKTEIVDCQALQSSLKDAYERIITTEKRADALQTRLEKIAKRKKKETASHASSGTKAKSTPGSRGAKAHSTAVTAAAPLGTYKKKLKLDLSRVSRQPVQKEAALVRGACRTKHEKERPASRASRSKRW